MDKADIIAYLKTWAKLHTQEVYGSPREYIHIWDLASELDNLARSDR